MKETTKKKKISITDIANSLNVSKTLVSMVINNHGNTQGISKATQKRVWEKIKEMNYKPNLIARSLRLGKSNTLGLIVSDISNSFYSKIARNIERYAESKGFNLIISSTDEEISREVRLINMLKDRQVDGLIISSSQIDSSEFDLLNKDNYPFVLIDRYIPSLKSNYVGVDNKKGAYDALMHLIKQGYDKIAVFAITPTYVSSINDRIIGYMKALMDSGLNYNKNLLKEIPFNNIKQSVKEELKKLLLPKNKINAIFAINNNVAIACIEYLNEMHIKIPEDVALICFDDIDLFKLTIPTITSVEQPIEEICKQAVDILISEIDNNINTSSNEKQHIEMPTNLLIRRSTVK